MFFRAGNTHTSTLRRGVGLTPLVVTCIVSPPFLSLLQQSPRRSRVPRARSYILCGTALRTTCLWLVLTVLTAKEHVVVLVELYTCWWSWGPRVLLSGVLVGVLHRIRPRWDQPDPISSNDSFQQFVQTGSIPSEERQRGYSPGSNRQSRQMDRDPGSFELYKGMSRSTEAMNLRVRFTEAMNLGVETLTALRSVFIRSGLTHLSNSSSAPLSVRLNRVTC